MMELGELDCFKFGFWVPDWYMNTCIYDIHAYTRIMYYIYITYISVWMEFSGYWFKSNPGQLSLE